jgi:type I restriction enzyme, S subunit
MGEWKEFILESVIDKFIDYRGKTPVKSPEGIPLITAKIVKSGRIIEPTEFIAEDNYNSWMRRGLPEINDIVLTTEAPLGEVALIKNKNVALAQRIITLRGDKSFVYNPFLKYYFQSTTGQYELDSRASGTTVFGIKAAVLKKMPILLPPLPEQKAIASVLSSLDDKIDLLHRQNKTLEALAETLFRQWFVEEARDDWEEAVLNDILSVKGGATPSTKNSEYWDGYIPWTTPRDLSGSNHIYLFDTERKITENGLAKISSGLLPIGTILLSSRASIGYLSITDVPVSINQGFIAILDDKGFSKYFIYLWVKINLEYIISNANGSTFLEISKSVFRGLEISVPPADLRQEFDKQVVPIFQKIKTNSIQIRTLEKLRETLLPKLMSGEVRVEYEH